MLLWQKRLCSDTGRGHLSSAFSPGSLVQAGCPDRAGKEHRDQAPVLISTRGCSAAGDQTQKKLGQQMSLIHALPVTCRYLFRDTCLMDQPPSACQLVKLLYTHCLRLAVTL